MRSEAEFLADVLGRLNAAGRHLASTRPLSSTEGAGSVAQGSTLNTDWPAISIEF